MSDPIRRSPFRAWSSLVRAGVFGLALAGSVLLSACGSISVNDNTPTSPQPPNYDQVVPPPAGARHDLAILGVDFDPALNVQTLLNHEPVTLIVGVSNQGNQRERNVQIKADLWSGDGSQRLLHTEQTVDSIAAGNVLPVRLVNTSTPPVLTHYLLMVQIVPVPGENNTQNNNRTLDITVNTN